MHDKAFTQALMARYYPKREAQIQGEYANKKEAAEPQPSKLSTSNTPQSQERRKYG